MACSGSSVAGDEPTLYLFSPSYIKANLMQNIIGELCPKVQVSVYGKSKDFRKQVQQFSPDGVIAAPLILNTFSGYKPVLMGEKSGNVETQLYLVSVGEAVQEAELAGKKIGVIDLLGRKPMTQYVKSLLGEVSTKRVGKSEDLLPLLNFNAADVLFITESELRDLTKTTQLKLKIVTTKFKLELPVMATLDVASGDPINEKRLVDCVRLFDTVVFEYLNIEKWRDSK